MIKRPARPALWLVPCVIVPLLVGCGGGGGSAGLATPTPTPTPTPSPQPPPPGAVTVGLTGSKPRVNLGESLTLFWASSNATSVVGSNFGATTLEGSAEVTPTASTTYTLTVEGPGGRQTASFDVAVAEVTVVVDPPGARLAPGASVTLTVTVGGAVDTFVNLKIEEPDGGTLTAHPLNAGQFIYTAPAVRTGTFHVVATSRADPGKSAVVAIQVG